jgi:hypothetical protein
LVKELVGLRRYARPGTPQKLKGFRDAWLENATCVKERIPPSFFDTEEPNFPHLEDALSICGRCPVTNECLAYALQNMPHYTGVVGNQMFWFGQIVKKMPITTRYGRKRYEHNPYRQFSR